MAATFRTRPLLMAVSARPAFSHTALAARGLMANMEQTRQYAASRRRIDPRFRNSIAYVKKNQSKQEATSSVMNNLMSEEKNHYAQGEMAMMAPSRFSLDILLPSVAYPSSHRALPTAAHLSVC